MEINEMSKLLQNTLDNNNLKNLFIHINKLDIPNNKLLQNAWAVYKPSSQTEHFISEERRSLYAEAQSFKRNENIKSLKELAIQTICDAYKGGPLTNILNPEDIQLLVDKLDVHWPIEKIYKLDINLYWKRVVNAYCKNRYLYLKGCKSINNDDFNWKDLGLASKFAELIENTYPENWVDFTFEKIAQLIAPYITNLEIHQLSPLKKQSIETNKYNQSYQIYNYPVMDCHHGNLKVLGILTNLKSLTLEFNIANIGLNYERRYFECSYLDIQNLADGIKNLNNLNTFKMNHSKMDDRKLKILVKSLILCPLENLDLSYCNLNDDSCKSIGYFLLHNYKLKSLELKGNNIGEYGVEYIGHSMKLYMGKIDYIGLAFNPIGENGVLAIGNCLCNRDDVHKLDFSSCVIDKNSAMQIIQIIGFHSALISIKMNSIPIEEEGGKIFVDTVEENFNILQIEYCDCGLNINQESSIKLLLERNIYYKEYPFLRKNHFTQNDVENIDELLKKHKHPLIEKSNAKQCEVYVNNISEFIPQEKNYLLTNSEILKTYIYDCFESERNIQSFDSIKHENSQEEAINENGELVVLNHFQRLEEISENAVIGQQINLFSANYYFKN